MDPASLALLVQRLPEIVAALLIGGAPVGIVWIIKNHKFRMRELELEAQIGISRRREEARLSAIEARLANIERALGSAPEDDTQQQRAAMLEGPATTGAEPTPRLSRLRTE